MIFISIPIAIAIMIIIIFLYRFIKKSIKSMRKNRRKKRRNKILQIPESIKRLGNNFDESNDILWKQFATVSEEEDFFSFLSNNEYDQIEFKKRILFSLLVPFNEWNIFNWKNIGAYQVFDDVDKNFIRELDKSLYSHLILLLDTLSKEMIEIRKKLAPYNIDSDNDYSGIDFDSYEILNGYFKCLMTFLPLLDNEDDINKVISMLEETSYHHHSFNNHGGYKNLLEFFKEKKIDEKYKEIIDQNIRKRILEEKNNEQTEQWFGFKNFITFYYYFFFSNLEIINEDKQYSINLLIDQMKFFFDFEDYTINLIRYLSKEQEKNKDLFKELSKIDPKFSKFLLNTIKERKKYEELEKKVKRDEALSLKKTSPKLRQQKIMTEKKRQRKLKKILATIPKSSKSS